MGLTITDWTAIGGFLLVVIGQSVTAIWYLARQRDAIVVEVKLALDRIDRKYAKEIGDVHERINKLTHDYVQDLRSTEHAFGGTADALRTKIHDFEVWSRDNFARREELDRSIDGLRVVIENVGNRMDASLLKMEGRLEKMQNRNHNPGREE